MSVLARFKDIISANVSDLLSRCEDEKEIDRFLLSAMNDLAEVKRDTADVLEIESRRRQRLEDAEAEVEKYGALAARALRAGNEDDARVLLAQKLRCEQAADRARRAYELAAADADRMRQLHDKLTLDIEALRSRRTSIRARLTLAEAQAQLNEADEIFNGGNN